MLVSPLTSIIEGKEAMSMWARYRSISARGKQSVYTKPIDEKDVDACLSYLFKAQREYEEKRFKHVSRFPTFEKYFEYETRIPKSENSYVRQLAIQQDRERHLARLREVFSAYA